LDKKRSGHNQTKEVTRREGEKIRVRFLDINAETVKKFPLKYDPHLNWNVKS